MIAGDRRLFDFILLVWPLLRSEGRSGQYSGLGVSIIPGRGGEPFYHLSSVDIRVAGHSSVLLPLDLIISYPLSPHFRQVFETFISVLVDDD